MKSLLPYIWMIGTLVVFGAAIVYVSRRFAFFFGVEKVAPFYIGFVSLFVFVIVGGAAFINSTSTVGHLLYMAAAFMLGFLLYLVLSVGVVDLVRLATDGQPKFYGIAALALTMLVSIYGVINSYQLTTTTLDIPVKGLTAEMKAVHLSDVHIGHFRNNGLAEELVAETNKHKPDVVFITGDYLDGKIALTDEAFAPLKRIEAPVFFVGGNHDEATDLDAIKQKLESAGVTVLENEVFHLGNLQIIGLDYMLADGEAFDMHASNGKPTVKKVLEQLDIDESKPSVLLHHGPSGIRYAGDKGVDLYLAGHTHAGQVFPINLISDLLFEYNRGLHDYNGMKVFVSEGIGTFGPPMRVGTKSEIAVLTLKPDV